MNKAFKHFFISIVATFFVILTLKYDLKLAFIFLLFFTPLFFIFMYFHQEKNMESVEFEINSSNKDPRKGLVDYRNQIDDFLFTLGYSKTQIDHQQYEFKPRPLQRTMGGNVIVYVHPLFIKIKGPKGLVMIIFKTLDVMSVE